MNSQTLRKYQERYVIGTYAPELIFTKGRGCYLWDIAGKCYLDFTSGIGVCNLGHCHPHVSAAISQQAKTLVHVSNLFMNSQQPCLAARIAEKSFGGKVFFANSGAEANEGMIKFARKWGYNQGKHKIIYVSNSFHGRLLGTLAATDKPQYKEGFGPHVEGFIRVPFNDISLLIKEIDDRVAAVMIEPVQGEGGVWVAEQEYLRDVREVCNTHNLLLLLDEIQCGMGRTGRWFSYQHIDGLEPDAMSMAKALGNGFPIGAFAIQDKHSSILTLGSHGTTFGGSPLACSAALAVFDVLEREKLVEHCSVIGKYFKDKLQEYSRQWEHVIEIRGQGLMIGIALDKDVQPIKKGLEEKGLLVLSAGNNVLRFLPPLIVQKSEIDTALTMIDQLLQSH